MKTAEIRKAFLEYFKANDHMIIESSSLVPGNDDAMRAITFYCELVQAAVLDGLQTELMKSGGDAGAAIEAPVEPALAEMASEDAAVGVPSADASADDVAAEGAAQA